MADFDYMEPGLPGQLADGTPATILSYTVEGNDVAAGVPVFQGTEDRQADESGAGDFLGIATRTATRDLYEEGDNIPVLAVGRVWLNIPSASVGDAYSDGTNDVLGSRVDATKGDLALVRFGAAETDAT